MSSASRYKKHDQGIFACRNLLTVLKIPYTVINQRAVETTKGWRHVGADPGTPDIIACLPDGTALLIDWKIGKDQLRHEQAAFFIRWKDCGAEAMVARDIGDLHRDLDMLIAKHRKRAMAFEI